MSTTQYYAATRGVTVAMATATLADDDELREVIETEMAESPREALTTGIEAGVTVRAGVLATESGNVATLLRSMSASDAKAALTAALTKPESQ